MYGRDDAQCCAAYTRIKIAFTETVGLKMAKPKISRAFMSLISKCKLLTTTVAIKYERQGPVKLREKKMHGLISLLLLKTAGIK